MGDTLYFGETLRFKDNRPVRQKGDKGAPGGPALPDPDGLVAGARGEEAPLVIPRDPLDLVLVPRTPGPSG